MVKGTLLYSTNGAASGQAWHLVSGIGLNKDAQPHLTIPLSYRRELLKVTVNRFY